VDCRCTNCNQEFHSYVFIREVTTRDESWKEYECRECGKETTQDYVGGM
jgi:DNA-directed RNA polymerase subunit RPC12/RpoP